MKAEVISIGTEILLGEITDLNAAYLASQLPLLGLDLHFISTAGDNRQRLVETLSHAWQRSDIIITTGGLGPTEDDVTREAIADFFNEPISIDEGLVKQFRELFSHFNMEMPPSNIKQASVIPSCRVIPNPRGTAPGWWVEKDRHVIIAMPGPPGEMQQMWTSVVAPGIQEKYCQSTIFSKTIKTFGLSEAKLGEITQPFLVASNPTVGIYAKPDGIHLRVTAKATTQKEAEDLVTATSNKIRELVGGCIWGTDSDTLEGIVANLFIDKKMTLATMEAGTGGILANNITNVPVSSDYFKYGIVINCRNLNSHSGINQEVLEKHGAISLEMAGEMASAVRRNHDASIGVGLIGVLESDTSGNKLGTIMIGIVDGTDTYTFSRMYPGTRMQVKQRAAISALYELRKIML